MKRKRKDMIVACEDDWLGRDFDHVIIVSNEPAPSMIPILDGRLNPQKIYLLYADDRLQYAIALKNALHHALPNIPIECISLMDGYDYKKLSYIIPKLRQQIGSQPLSINFTGGTKLITLAFWLTFKCHYDSCFYVSPKNRSLINLHNPNSLPIMPTKNPAWNLETFLLAFGWKIDSPIQKTSIPKDEWNKYLKTIRMIQQNIKHGEKSKGNGNWLERYVYECCRRAQRKLNNICDVGGSFVIQQNTPLTPSKFHVPVRNEIDTAILLDKSLIVVESKNGSAAEGSAAMHALYKLKQLVSSVGGWISKGVFVSSRLVSEAIHKRADEYGIVVFDISKLDRLTEHLIEYINKIKNAGVSTITTE